MSVPVNCWRVFLTASILRYAMRAMRASNHESLVGNCLDLIRNSAGEGQINVRTTAVFGQA